MTEQELEDYFTKIGEGCKWYDEHPECFETYNNGWQIRIIDENIPKAARFYVEDCNKRYESMRKKDEVLNAMGISSGKSLEEALPGYVPPTFKVGHID